ncbi:SGNH hydrolase-type esterase domain-containing protein [Stachybotrys elegans]|uniref:SGNH hydrolase-type esterase domain-containing protein n=1 Tax=Stachybotrys elegans TaxID=80388 RepID=A0A8K0SDC9_9HYPO|nr:SGNH hydrolase-type esterase domain-containing protein [Stachybotrys elegans]
MRIKLQQKIGARIPSMVPKSPIQHSFFSVSSNTYSPFLHSALYRSPFCIITTTDAVGGSITQGVGSSDRNGYRKALYEMLRSHHYNVRMVGSRKVGTMQNNENEGWRGFKIDEIEAKAKKSVNNLLPNLITLNAGSNDCLQKFNLHNIDQRMSGMLDFLWSASPGSTIILSTLLVNADKETDSRVVAVNQMLRALVEQKAAEKRRIVLADMYTADGPGLGDLGDDGIHPGDDGYMKMAAIWFQSIQEASMKGLIQESKTRDISKILEI